MLTYYNNTIIIDVIYINHYINMETRKERFKRIATYRTNEIIDRIRILGNCSNKSTYEYTKEDIDKIYAIITKELKDTRSKFSSVKRDKFVL